MGVIPMRGARAGRPVVEAAQEPARLQEVLDVAGRLFNEKGYRATSLAEIGEALGMNKASLYYYVRSKEDLIRKLIVRASGRLRNVARDPQLDTLPADQALERLVREHCAVILEFPNEMGLLVQQRRFIEPEALGDLVERERIYVAYVRGVIARGVTEGSFRPVDPGIATQLLLDTINGLLRWFRPAGKRSANSTIDEAWAFILGGLRAGAPSRRTPRK
jgi:AcrR family transcriptional regulator